MDFLRIFVCTFLCVFPVRSNLHICDVSECECREKTIICRDKNPQWFFIEENFTYLYLDFRYCAIEFIVAGYLDKFRKLRQLDIRGQTVPFKCQSLPEKREYAILSECEFTSTSLPNTTLSELLPTHMNNVTLKDFSPTDHIYNDTIKSSLPNTPELTVSYSSVLPSISETITDYGITSQIENADRQTTINNLFDSTLNVTYSDFSPVNEYDNSTAASLISPNTDKIAWIVLTVAISILIMTMGVCISILFFLRKRRLTRQLQSSMRFRNNIYTGSFYDFNSIHQMMTQREENMIIEEDDDEDDGSSEI